MNQVQSPFAVLGVPVTAELSEIKTAYRALAKQYHPDINPNNQVATQRFQEIKQAYEFLLATKQAIQRPQIAQPYYPPYPYPGQTVPGQAWQGSYQPGYPGYHAPPPPDQSFQAYAWESWDGQVQEPPAPPPAPSPVVEPEELFTPQPQEAPSREWKKHLLSVSQEEAGRQSKHRALEKKVSDQERLNQEIQNYLQSEWLPKKSPLFKVRQNAKSLVGIAFGRSS